MAEIALTETKTAFAKRCGVSPGRVSQWLSDGKLKPEHVVGIGRAARIVIEPALAHLRGVLDPGMSKIPAFVHAAAPEPVASAERVEGQPLPDPAEYRGGGDHLPDDPFARGALYAAHAVAHSIPCLLACELKEAGCSDEIALSAYTRHSGAHAGFLVSDALCALGLATEAELEPGRQHPLAPTHFAGFNPSGRWG